MSGPKKNSDQPGSNYQEEIPKGRKPTDHQTVKKPETKKNIKETDTRDPAKEREQSEQPVHSIKKSPKKV